MTPPLGAALIELAALLEARCSVRAALCEWHVAIDDARISRHLRRVAGRLRLGADIGTALEPLAAFGDDGRAIRRVVISHAIHGGSLSSSLRSIASAFDARERLEHESRAASAAARLSGRLLGGLAIGSLVLISVSRDAPLGQVVMSSGMAAVLATVGMAWMKRLQPAVPASDPPVAALADLVAGLVGGGMDLTSALDIACAGDATGSDLERVARRVHLGMPWPDALQMSPDPAHRALAATIRRAYRSGLPIRDALSATATDLRERQRRGCTLQARRAPVLLMLPLVLCFLPAFGLVMVVPLMRAVTG